MNRTIQYAVNKDDGLVISRVGREIAVPVLDYEKIGEGGDFTRPLEYHLEKMPVIALGRDWPRYVWTRKIPTELKNEHREFWGFSLLEVADAAEETKGANA